MIYELNTLMLEIQARHIKFVNKYQWRIDFGYNLYDYLFTVSLTKFGVLVHRVKFLLLEYVLFILGSLLFCLTNSGQQF